MECRAGPVGGASPSPEPAPFSTTLFCLGAKMLCNRIARAITGDSIAALRRPVPSGQFCPDLPPTSSVRAIPTPDLCSSTSPNIEQDKKGSGTCREIRNNQDLPSVSTRQPSGSTLRECSHDGDGWNLFLGPVKWWFPRKGQSSDHASHPHPHPHPQIDSLPSLPSPSDFGLSQITPQPCASRYRRPSLAPTSPEPKDGRATTGHGHGHTWSRPAVASILAAGIVIGVVTVQSRLSSASLCPVQPWRCERLQQVEPLPMGPNQRQMEKSEILVCRVVHVPRIGG